MSFAAVLVVCVWGDGDESGDMNDECASDGEG